MARDEHRLAATVPANVADYSHQTWVGLIRCASYCAAAIVLCACATKAPVQLDGGRTVGAALVDAGPTVNFPTTSGAEARVAATAALTPIVGLLGLFAFHPDAVVRAGKYVNQEAERATCLNSMYKDHPELEREITGLVDRESLKKMVFDQVLSYLRARTSLRVVAVQEGTGLGDLTHETALRQARASGIDVLFELSQIEVDFDVGGGTECVIRRVVRLKYRTMLVSGEKELETGYARNEAFTWDETGSDTVSRWLSDRDSLAKSIETGYRDAMPQIWYTGLPTSDSYLAQ